MLIFVCLATSHDLNGCSLDVMHMEGAERLIFGIGLFHDESIFFLGQELRYVRGYYRLWLLSTRGTIHTRNVISNFSALVVKSTIAKSTYTSLTLLYMQDL